jgi:predicted nucleotidyltransferase
MTPRPDFAEILRVLTSTGVDFIVVGGVAAVLQGAPISTFDLDLVHRRGADNVERLLEALRLLDARYRGQPGRKVIPDRSDLSSPGHQLLMTRAGPLDLLGVVGQGQGYEELLEHTVEMAIAPGTVVRVLDLAVLIRTKDEAGREKDRAVLAVLRRTLEERSRT